MRFIKKIVAYCNRKGVFFFLSDKSALKLVWWASTDNELNIEHPIGFNEKLNWIKLYDRNPLYVELVDKYRVRGYVSEKIGEKYLIPLLGVWNDPKEIDFEKLPDRFVLKCNHNSGGGMYICTDKSKLKKRKAVKILQRALNKNYYFIFREWAYKNVESLVLAEEYIEDLSTNGVVNGLIDYKFYCFNGQPKFLYVSSANIVNNVKHDLITYLDLNWNTPPFSRPDHPQLSIDIEKPEAFDEMIEIAKRLSEGIPFVRVDMYYVNKKILFSELTLYPGGGLGFFSPNEWEQKIGSWIDLSDAYNYKVISSGRDGEIH